MNCRRTAALVLAAGRSSRMGSFKPLLPLGASNIILTTVNTLNVCCDEVGVVIGRNADMVYEALSPYTDLKIIYNKDYENTSMFFSVLMGVDYFKDRCDRLFVLPCDIPAFSVNTLYIMLRHMDETGAKVVKPIFNGRAGHPVLINSKLFRGILEYDGNRGLAGAIEALGGAETTEVPDYGILLDADTQEDYKNLIKYYESKELPTADKCETIENI